METQDKFAQADALRELAKAQLEEGNVDAAEKYIEEVEHLQTLAEKEADTLTQTTSQLAGIKVCLQ